MGIVEGKEEHRNLTLYPLSAVKKPMPPVPATNTSIFGHPENRKVAERQGGGSSRQKTILRRRGAVAAGRSIAVGELAELHEVHTRVGGQQVESALEQSG